MLKFLTLFILSSAILAACNGIIDESSAQAGQSQNQPLSQDEAYDVSQSSESYNEWTIDELGAIIVAAGSFWENWWNLTGPFAWEYFVPGPDFSDVPELTLDIATGSPEHLEIRRQAEEIQAEWDKEWMRLPRSIAERRTWMPLLPSSASFTGINDVRDYLLRYYTPEWVYAELYGEHTNFVEYGGLFYVCITRAGFSRPDWSRAVHKMIEQSGSHAVVKTTVPFGSWHRPDIDKIGYGFAEYIFTFVDGLISEKTEVVRVN